MVKSLNYQETTAKQIAALYAIRKSHQVLIKGDNILKSDFEKLMQYLSISNQSSVDICTQIISHLAKEIHKPVEEGLYSGEEQPDYQNEVIVYSDPGYFRLKDAMNDFYLNHLE